MRKAAGSMSTVVQLTKKSETEYSLNSTILLFTTSQKFTPGVGKNVKTVDGRKVFNVFEIDGSKLIEKQIGEKTMIIEREFFDDELIVTSSIGDVVCKSWCKLVE